VSTTRRSSRLASVARWLGLPGAERLSGAVAVLSPHLDDGVLSLGAAIAAASGPVVVLTVLAGDPESDLPAGEWDSRAGFRTAGEATRARREEDARACEEVGAQPEWLPYFDQQYPRPDDDGIWEEVERGLGPAETVLVPAFPLMHEDHRWLLGLVERHGLPGRQVGHYVEQPYAAAWEPRLPGDEWSPLGAALPHRLRKLHACRRYATQLPLLESGGRVLLPMVRYEAARGGELVRWP
jgi:LmbE family N-acetylglucosaminyl deacetylase